LSCGIPRGKTNLNFHLLMKRLIEMKKWKIPRRFFLLSLLAVILTVGSRETTLARGGEVAVTFTNATPKSVTLHRLDHGKAAQSFDTIAPGKVLAVQSLPGQIWILLKRNNKELGRYLVTPAPRQSFLISMEGANGPLEKAVPADPAAKLAGNTGTKVGAQEAQQLINYHNEKRQEVGAAPLTWSPKIAQYAQGRADTIARTKKFAHLPQGRNPYGENLAQGGSGGGVSGFTALNAAESWYAEKAKMPKGARIMTMDLFNRGVGHYTQMIWKGTTEIGVGIANFQQNGLAMTIVVCCYHPPGNFISGTIF
jgi:uncharacterized protein YkwD